MDHPQHRITFDSLCFHFRWMPGRRSRGRGGGRWTFLSFTSCVRTASVVGPTFNADLVRGCVPGTLPGVLRAELGLCSPSGIGRPFGTALVTARIFGDVDHPLLGVLGAELALCGTLNAVPCSRNAAWTTAPFVIGRHDADHPLLGMSSTELTPFATFYTERRLRGAARVSAPLADAETVMVYHPVLRVLRAELAALSPACCTVCRPFDAALVLAPLVVDVNHSSLSMLRAKFPRRGALYTV